jgi:hypothetical protein
MPLGTLTNFFYRKLYSFVKREFQWVCIAFQYIVFFLPGQRLSAWQADRIVNHFAAAAAVHQRVLRCHSRRGSQQLTDAVHINKSLRLPPPPQHPSKPYQSSMPPRPLFTAAVAAYNITLSFFSSSACSSLGGIRKR